MRKNSSFIFLFLFILIAIFLASFLIFQIKLFENEILKLSFYSPPPSFLKRNPSITLVFVGDIMLDRGVKEKVKKYGNGDWKFPFLKVAKELQEADILIGNLEGPISNKGKKVGSIYSFRAEPEVIEGLKFAGFDLLSVANNHIFDYGREAMEDTFKRLKEAKIYPLGGGFNQKEACEPLIKKIKGTKIAFLAFTNLGSPFWQATMEKSGICWLEEEKMKEKIKEAKEKAEIVIVSFHYGTEYLLKPTEFQIRISRVAIESGADLVVGHHPHVIQPIEKYKEGYIAYSLGNFVFDQNFSKNTTEGLILEVLVKGGKIEKVKPIKVKINQFFQPEIIEELKFSNEP